MPMFRPLVSCNILHLESWSIQFFLTLEEDMSEDLFSMLQYHY